MAVITTRRYLLQIVHQLETLGEREHGHHGYLEVGFKNSTVEEVDGWVHRQVLEPARQNDLSEWLEMPTGENFVQWAQKQLLLSPLKTNLVSLAFQETEKNRFFSSLTGSKYV